MTRDKVEGVAAPAAQDAFNPGWCLAGLAAGAISLAVSLQVLYGWEPCPWCILQRYAYAALFALAVVRAAVPRGRLTQSVDCGLLLVSVAGMGMALVQLSKMASMSTSCGRDALAAILNEMPTARYLPVIFESTGHCADAVPLNFPVLSLVCLGIFAFFSVRAIIRR